MTPRTPEDVDRLFGEALNKGDLDALVALYEPGASLVGRDGNFVTGRDAIRGVFANLLPRKPTIQMNVVRVVSAGDVAALYNDWSMVVSGAEGEERRSGKALEIVRRQPDGSWRFVIDDGYARG